MSSSDIRGDIALGWGGVAAAPASASSSANNDGDGWGWRLQNNAVRPVPAFYPMDSRSTRRINLTKVAGEEAEETGEENNENKINKQQQEVDVGEVSRRISTACQKLSIHGIWDNSSPSASLSSMERVEMDIAIYSGNDTSNGK